MSEYLERLRAAYDNLNLRERSLLGIAGGLLTVLIIVLAIVQPLLSARSGAQQRGQAGGSIDVATSSRLWKRWPASPP